MESNLISYQEFREQYEDQHPASLPTYTQPLADNPRWMPFALLAMFIFSALLSGVHTVPTAYSTIEAGKVSELVRQIAALGTFVFIELGILITAYSMFKKWSWIAFLVLAFCIIIAMAANLYSVYHAMQSNDDGSRIVGVLFGLAAPFIAMMTGKLYVNVQRSEQIAEYKARQQYNEQKINHDKAIEESWLGYNAAMEKRAEKIAERERIRIEREAEQVHSLNSLNGMNEQNRLSYSANSSIGYTKRMDAKEIITEYFTNHPDMLNAKLDELVNLIEGESSVKVGRTSVHNVRKSILEGSGK